jgi:hypothetical protein
VFLALLLVAVQLLVNLYATSVVTAVGFDAARVVAGSASREGGPGYASAEADARRALGRYGRRVTFDWSGSDDDTVVLRLRADNPNFVVRRWAGSLGFDHVDRTVRVRVERMR